MQGETDEAGGGGATETSLQIKQRKIRGKSETNLPTN
jgi:hypothetical protein